MAREPHPPFPRNWFSFFLLKTIRSMHDWSNDPEQWSSCSGCGSIGLLGDDGEVLPWGWMNAIGKKGRIYDLLNVCNAPDL